MPSTRRNLRSRFVLETLEGRIALSHMGAVVEDGPHRNRGGHAEIQATRPRADDPAGHEAGEHQNGNNETLHHHRGR